LLGQREVTRRGRMGTAAQAGSVSEGEKGGEREEREIERSE
jgi:hypothetical protein